MTEIIPNAESKSIGFVGLGIMGGAIAERLAERGFDLHVCDLNGEAVKRLTKLGAVACSNPKHVADMAETIFTCLPTLEACRTVILGPGGLINGTKIRRYVEMSTTGPAALEDFAVAMSARGIATIDAPVSGGAAGARAGTLAIMLAGPSNERELVRPYIEAISDHCFVIGDRPGDAQKMKLVNNLLAAANMATAFEALALGTKLGLQPSKIVEVVRASSGMNSGMVARKIDPILTGTFSGLGAIALLEKDIGLAFDAARHVDFPLSELRALTGMAELWHAAVEQGLAGHDISALIRVIERGAKIEVREETP